MFFNALHLATAALLLTHTTIAHINIASPPPRQHKNNPFTIGEPDYNMLEPLYGGVSVRPYPCRGYSKSQSVVSTAPGATINIDLEGSATHEFGHCQFAISYDDETFVVLKTVKDTCLDGSSVIGPNLRRYSLTLPSDLPECTNGCTLAWTWINNVGNREYYMNCVDIKTVGGPKSGTVSGKQLFVAHVPGYPTIPEPSVGSVTDCWLNARPSISLQISNGVLQSVSGGSRGVFPAPSTSASNTCPGTTTGGVIPSIPSSGTACGGGVVGNGKCANSALCCSAYGYCGTGAGYCSASTTTTIRGANNTAKTTVTARTSTRITSTRTTTTTRGRSTITTITNAASPAATGALTVCNSANQGLKKCGGPTSGSYQTCNVGSWVQLSCQSGTVCTPLTDGYIKCSLT